MTPCIFFDDVANERLNIDGVDETVLYVAFVGGRAAAGVPSSVSMGGVERV
jgi:hypothetical protein